MVTDDQGRYVIPDLPKANYSVWVRGYGLVDSPKVTSAPGKTREPDRDRRRRRAAAAAEYYPGMYWYSLLKIPAASEFPGTGDKGNGIPADMKTQDAWVDTVKNSCQSCHALGSQGHPHALAEARDVQELPRGLGAAHAVRPGDDQHGAHARLHRARQGAQASSPTGPTASPPASCRSPSPSGPKGVERNVVVTMWDCSTPKYYLHDAISSDKHNPHVNANGPIYGSPEESTDLVPVLDPVKNTASTIKHPVLDPKTPSSKTNCRWQPSPYWGDEPIWDGHTSIHNAMMDEQGRVWFSARIRPDDESGLLQEGLGPSVGEGRAAGRTRSASSRCTIRRRRSGR